MPTKKPITRAYVNEYRIPADPWRRKATIEDEYLGERYPMEGEKSDADLSNAPLRRVDPFRQILRALPGAARGGSR